MTSRSTPACRHAGCMASATDGAGRCLVHEAQATAELLVLDARQVTVLAHVVRNALVPIMVAAGQRGDRDGGLAGVARVLELVRACERRLYGATPAPTPTTT